MDKLFQIGDFIFRLCCPAEVRARKEYSDPDGEMEQGIKDFIREYLKYVFIKGVE